MKVFTRNLSLRRQPCVCVAAMVVSLINERLSPKKAPPTTTAVIIAIGVPVLWAIPAAMGTRATMVPTLVPMLKEIKQAARKSPARSICAGSKVSVRFTVASILPMTLAELANAPARTKIQSISIRLPVPAPRLKVSIRFFKGSLPEMATAKMLLIMKATVMGTL